MVNKTNAKVKKEDNKINTGRNIKKHKKVLIMLALLCIIIYLFGIVLKLFKNPTSTFVVEQGQIYQEESAIGYI